MPNPAAVLYQAWADNFMPGTKPRWEDLSYLDQQAWFAVVTAATYLMKPNDPTDS